MEEQQRHNGTAQLNGETETATEWWKLGITVHVRNARVSSNTTVIFCSDFGIVEASILTQLKPSQHYDISV